jgi:hypothetical protein
MELGVCLVTQHAAKAKAYPPPLSGRRLKRSGPLLVEQLEDRTLLSWTALGPAQIGNGQTPGNQNVTGRIAALAQSATNSSTIYAGTSGGGVWRTANGGTNWTQLTDTQNTLTIGAIAVTKLSSTSTNDVVFAGTGEANNSADSYYGIGLLRSTDSGANWTQLTGPSNAFNRRTFSKIILQPSASNQDINHLTIYAAVSGNGANGLTGNGGIWNSTDGGTTWTNTTSVSDVWSDLVVDPLDANHLFAAAGAPDNPGLHNGVFQTTNGGASWNGLSLPNTITASSVGRISLGIAPGSVGPPVIPPTLFVSIANATDSTFYAMLRTSDNGTNWTTLTTNVTTTSADYFSAQGDYNNVLAVDPNSSTTIYAGGGGQIVNNVGGSIVLRTTDNGSTWTDISRVSNNDNGPHADDHAMAFNSSGQLLLGTDGGIWQLNSSGTWTDLNGDLRVAEFVGIAARPTDSTIATAERRITEPKSSVAMRGTSSGAGTADSCVWIQRRRRRSITNSPRRGTRTTTW